ncbi:MAG: galactokinase [SAR324 cluster bacterium]|nr:galactokinase [SAR324 cluster bacterium]
MENQKKVFQTLEELFRESFGNSHEETRWFFAPGRVNLIGEHIDYCGGSVLPAALQMGTFAVARRKESAEIVLESTSMENRVSFCADDPVYLESDGWGNYPKGIFAEYHQRDVPGQGLEILYHGNIPGGGLSSSASIEVCTAFIIETLNQFRLDSDTLQNRKEIARLCQHSENHFNGMNCGVMDQAAVALGKKGHAILMDCSDLAIEYVPFELGDYALLIGNTCKVRKLTNSKYNERRAEVEKALALVQKHRPVNHLCELKMGELESTLGLLPDPILKRRTRHIITENNRVHEAVDALRVGQLNLFGQLLIESHQSLKDDFEVTGQELDTLVEASLAQKGVLGARMTGGGFGGCMIALVHHQQIEAFKHNVSAHYQSKIGYFPEFYQTIAGSGANEISKS